MLPSMPVQAVPESHQWYSCLIQAKCSDKLQQLLRRCLQGLSQTPARVDGSVLPAGIIAVHGPLRSCGLQARVCVDPEPLRQHRAAALVGQQHRSAMHGQLRQMSLMASGVWPQPQRFHQGLIILQLVRPQIHLQEHVNLLCRTLEHSKEHSVRAQLDLLLPGRLSLCRKQEWAALPTCTLPMPEHMQMAACDCMLQCSSDRYEVSNRLLP